MASFSDSGLDDVEEDGGLNVTDACSLGKLNGASSQQWQSQIYSTFSSSRSEECPICHLNHEGVNNPMVTDAVVSPTSRYSCPAVHPEFAEINERKKSYVGWPETHVGQPARKMAAAGFYYIGSADRVRCFFCGKTLRNWQEDDDPFLEHKSHSPNCVFANCYAASPVNWQEYEETACATVNSTSPMTSLQTNASVDKIMNRSNQDITQDSSPLTSTNTQHVSETTEVQKESLTPLRLSEGQVSRQGEGQVSRQDEGLSKMDISDSRYTIMIEAVREMDVPLEVIEKVIAQRKRSGQAAFQSAAELFAAVLDFDDTENKENLTPSVTVPATAVTGMKDLCTDAPATAGELQNSLPLSGGKFQDSTSSVASPPSAVTPHINDKKNLQQTHKPDLVRINQTLKNQSLCRLCKREKCCVTFLPCGHYVSCQSCSDESQDCFVCHRRILGTVKTYLA